MEPMKKAGINEATESWEGEGGAVPETAKPLTGTADEVAHAQQIKAQVNAEVDRIGKAMEAAAAGHVGQQERRGPVQRRGRGSACPNEGGMVAATASRYGRSRRNGYIDRPHTSGSRALRM